MENPIKMDDLGGTTIFGNIHIDPMNFPAIHGSVHILYRDPHRLQDQPIKPFKGWGLDTKSNYEPFEPRKKKRPDTFYEILVL